MSFQLSSALLPAALLLLALVVAIVRTIRVFCNGSKIDSVASAIAIILIVSTLPQMFGDGLSICSTGHNRIVGLEDPQVYLTYAALAIIFGKLSSNNPSKND
jgi:hypothetical protein